MRPRRRRILLTGNRLFRGGSFRRTITWEEELGACEKRWALREGEMISDKYDTVPSCHEYGNVHKAGSS